MKTKLKIIILVRVIESFFNHSIFAWQNGRPSPPSALPLICVRFLPLMFFGLDLLSYWWLSLTVCRVISTKWTTLWGWFLATDGHFQHCWRVTRSHLCPFWCCLGNHTMSTWLTRQQSNERSPELSSCYTACSAGIFWCTMCLVAVLFSSADVFLSTYLHQFFLKSTTWCPWMPKFTYTAG